MKIVKQLKLKKYITGEFLSIGEKRSYNNRIIKCIAGSGSCSGKNGEGICIFCGEKECTDTISMNCTKYIRPDGITASFIYDD